MNLKRSCSHFFRLNWAGFGALMIATHLALMVCLQWLPYDLYSRRMLAIFFGQSILYTVIIWSILRKWLVPFYRNRTFWIKIGSGLTALALGAIIVLNVGIQLPERPLILPSTTLTIRNTAEKNERSAGILISLKLFETGLTDSFSAFTQTGNWELSSEDIRSENAAELSWHGKVDKELRLTFRTGPAMGIVKLTIGKSEQTIDLFNPAPNEIYLVTPFHYPPINTWFIFSAYWLSISFFCWLALTCLIQPRRKKQTTNLQQQRTEPWWIYSLPIMLAGMIILRTYWPALMNQDAFSQWIQAMTGVISDWHPASYTLLIRLLQRFSASPAIVPVVQIAALSLVVSDGIAFLRSHGLSRPAAWLITALFAFSPVVLLFQISILKDVPFGISFLAAFLIFLRIVLTDGKWLNKPKHQFALILSGAGMALFRHNGLPVIIAALILFFLLYRCARKPVLLSALGLIGLVVFIRGPLFSLLQIEKNGGTGINQLYMHTISAQLAEGTPLTETEAAWLNNLYPLDQWTYNPWTVGSLLKWPAFDRERLYANTSQNFRIFRDLTLRKPLITLQHMLRASDMIWHIPCRGCYLYKVILSEQPSGNYEWIIQNHVGIRQNSKIPALVKPIYQIYDITSSNPWFDALIWRPAAASYWIFLVAILLALRNEHWKFMLIGALPLIQFCLMLLITFAQDMRFLYGVILCALFSVGLLFLPVRLPSRSKRQEEIPGECEAGRSMCN